MVLGVLRKQSNFETDLDLTFRFKLARELGMTVGELMTTMSSMEYNQWIAYYCLLYTSDAAATPYV